MIIGFLATAMSRALATSSSGETRTSAKSGRAFSRSTADIVSVMSICRNSVTCGAVNALTDTAAAVCLRTPRIGIRSSLTPAAVAGAAAAGASGASAAASTSSRVTVLPGPVPVTVARSTPRSRASLRTGGLASTATRLAGSGAASAAAAAGSGDPVTGAAAGAPVPGAAAAGFLRGRRVVGPSFTP